MWIKEDTFYDPEAGFYWFREVPDYSSINEELKNDLDNYRFEKKIEYIYFNITEKCNADCPYCYVPREKRQSGESFNRDEFFEVMGKLEKSDVRTILFHGVEPLLEKEMIFEAIEDFASFNYGVQTNGFLLEESDIEFLKNEEANIGLSIDAPRKEINDFLRGKGHFENTISLLERLKGYSGLSVITTINSFNEHLLAEHVELLSKYVETILMNPVRGTSKGAREMRPNNLTENFLKAVEKAMELTKKGNRTTIGDYANIVLGIIAPTSRVLQCDISPCGAGRRFISITPNGVYPCTEFISINEFRRSLESLEKALNGEAFPEVTSRKTEDIEGCTDCEYRHLCGAPCPAEVYKTSNSLHTKSPYCEFYKNIISHAFKTVRENKEDLVINKDILKKTHEIER